MQELLAQPEILDYRGRPAALVNQDKMVIQDSKDSLVQQANQDRRVHWVNLDSRVLKVQPDNLDLKVSLETREFKASQVLLRGLFLLQVMLIVNNQSCSQVEFYCSGFIYQSVVLISISLLLKNNHVERMLMINNLVSFTTKE